ncbi:phosphotransferase family protein [Sedimentitalea sp. HM32M-2]|uniref:phosphotransferase family protein n=1 Tax=Sedimentitalea sp. HM32M-2 TaxID=3351566 RepID=UPI003639C8A9
MTDTALDLDLEAVGSYLTKNLPGFSGPLSARKFAGGQSNPTYLLETPDRNYVLRRKPPGTLLKSAHAVDREYRVQRALADTPVPVAEMHLLCRDDSVIGSMFYVMSHVAGRNFPVPTLPELARAERGAVIDQMNQVLATLHNVDIEAAGLSDYGPSGSYFERQLGRWSKQYRASETGTIHDMDRLMRVLAERLPPEDGQRTLVHGDYRIDNMIFAETGPTCLAVLDWELSTIGHPFADLASVIMQWQMPCGPEGRGLAGIDRDALGLPSDQAFIDSYCARRGLSEIENFGFYLGFSFFRMAAILQGVHKRALDGNASNPAKARQLGGYVPLFAGHGLRALTG